MIADRHDQNSSVPVQASASRPTRENFVRVLNAITSVANPGSFVYIHFSGHGTQKKSGKEKEPVDVGLVFLNEDVPTGISYLWGEKLSDLIKLLVDSDLAVTVVLDCCFSGGVYRRGPEVRYLPYDVKMELGIKEVQRNSLEAQSHSSEVQSHSGYRDISFLPKWLVDSKKFAVITACGPDEVTDSQKFDGQINGIFSYYLFDTLKYIGLGGSLKTVHDRLCAKVRGYRFEQNPILYGNKDQGFFGPSELNSARNSIPVIKKDDGTLELQAGYAHGMSTGDKFAVSSAKGETMSKQPSLFARARQCNSLTSILEVPDPSTNTARTGWSARVISQSWLQRIPIRLASNIPDKPLWISALEIRSLKAHNHTSGIPASFELVLDGDQQYQVLDDTGSKLANLPAMLQHQIDPDKVCDILEHLVQFQLTKSLNNEVSAVDHLDKVEISIRCDGKSYGPMDNIAMKHNTTAEVVVTNNRDKPVFVFVYDLGPSWQVEQIFGGSCYLVYEESFKKPFKMTVPELVRDQGYETCVDILKVIVTSQPTSFDVLELPRLMGELAKRKGGEADRGAPMGPENWVAMNFTIHTSIGKEKNSFMTPNANQ